jgi:hypothetical protein
LRAARDAFREEGQQRVDGPRAKVEAKTVRLARLAITAVPVVTAACSLLLPYDEYDRGFHTVEPSDGGGDERKGPSDALESDAGPEADADAGPTCVMPPAPQCDADIATDLANCGACGHQCRKANGACTVGVCDPEVAYAVPFVSPVGVAADDNYFYGVGGIFLGTAEGGVARAKKDGNGSDVLALYTKDPRRLALSTDGKDVYWTQAGAIAHSPNNPLPDGSSNVADTFVSGQSNPTSIAIDDTHVFWTNPPPDGDGDVWRASLKTPSDAQAIVTHADGMNAYGVAVDAQYVYWTSNTQGGSVWRADKNAALAAPVAIAIAKGQSYPSDVFVDGEAIYWTNSSVSDGAIMKLAKGAAAPVVLASKRVEPGGVHARDPYVYWYENGATNKDIMRVAKCGGSPVRLVVGQKVTDLTVEDLNVYWATGDAVVRVAR